MSEFSFELKPGESIGDRIVRCCHEALDAGPMGQNDRHDFYRDFIACEQEESDEAAEALTGVRTSCAMFVRAVRHWCGAPPTGKYLPGTGMFTSMGKVGYNHPSFVACTGDNSPNPGDYFFICPDDPNKGHTGIFLAQHSDDESVWDTAEGGGGDGTLCRIRERKITGKKFEDDDRTLRGWFDCTQVGLPESPAETQ
jgi:hypothetical protein